MTKFLVHEVVLRWAESLRKYFVLIQYRQNPVQLFTHRKVHCNLNTTASSFFPRSFHKVELQKQNTLEDSPTAHLTSGDLTRSKRPPATPVPIHESKIPGKNNPIEASPKKDCLAPPSLASPALGLGPSRLPSPRTHR